MEQATFIGLDLSLNGSGIVVLSDGVAGLQCLFAKKLLPKGVFGTARLAWLSDVFQKEIVRRWFPVVNNDDDTFVAVEDYAMRGSGRVASLAEWSGIAKLHVYRCGLPMLIINNSTLKAYAGGKEKPEVAAGVKRLCAARKLEVDFGKDYDLWDACGLALMLRDRVKRGDSEAALLVAHAGAKVKSSLTKPKTDAERWIAHVAKPQWDTLRGPSPNRKTAPIRTRR